MVYKVIREHKGEISVDSREGEGTNFEIVLPIPQKERRMIAYNERSDSVKPCPEE